MGIRLGLDLGTNSIGWCLLETKDGVPINLRKAGVRIFSDGRDPQRGEPLAVERRLARGARRRRDRLLQRKRDLRKFLMSVGLFPLDESSQQTLKNLHNPYDLRVSALKEKLSPYDLGRSLIHMSQRRGFKSSRKGDKKEDKVEKNDRDALDLALKENGLTLGQYLKQRHDSGWGTRARPGDGLTTLRSHYYAEFCRIRDEQKPHHSLSDDDWKRIEEILFTQRPLRPAQRGNCQIYYADGEVRAYRAMPSFQRFRIEQNLSNFKVNGNPLTPDQRQKIREKLLDQKTKSFGSIRTTLGLNETHSFNLESDKKTSLEGDTTAYVLSKKEYFGKSWFSLDLKKQDEIVIQLLEEGEPETLIKKAMEDWGLSKEQAENLAKLEDTKLESGTARFCARALHELIPIMVEQGLSVTESIAQLRGGYGHNRRGEKELKYYGEVIPDSVVPQPRSSVDDEKIYGKINNPTVHIGLNQLRKLVNELIIEYGIPDEMIVELSRELKLTQDAKKELNKKQGENKKLNDEAKEKIEGQGLQANTENILRYKLWKELDQNDCNNRRSPYSGKPISITQLFSNQIEIEHILPLSRTLDDSYNNKTLCFVDENRMKGNYAPAEACQKMLWNFDHDEMLERVAHLPRKKRYRFEADAMQRWEEKEGGFIARQLTDTQYLSKVAKRYLESLYPDDGKLHVRVIPGQLTAKLRGQWGLNSILSGEGNNEKNRNDHRHHAIDAIIIGCTDQRLLQHAAKNAEQLDSIEFDPPFGTVEDFRHAVKEQIDPIIVSHRPDHGWQGAMHEGTNYGIIDNQNDYERDNNYNVVYRKPFVLLFAGLEPNKARDKASEIRDARLRNPLMNLLEKAESKEEVTKIVTDFAKEKGIKNIRILKKEATIIPIEHPSENKKFKKGVVPGSNHHIAFWRMPDKSVQALGISFYDMISRKDDLNSLKPHPAAKLVCHISNGDLIRVTQNEADRTLKVVNLSPANKLFWCIDHQEGGNLSKRYKEKDLKYFFLSFSKMADYKVRKIHITPTGKIYDSGSIF